MARMTRTTHKTLDWMVHRLSNKESRPQDYRQEGHIALRWWFSPKDKRRYYQLSEANADGNYEKVTANLTVREMEFYLRGRLDATIMFVV